MAAYNIYEAKTAFSALIEKAEHGEETVIARAGKPVAKIVPIHDPRKPGTSKSYRKGGQNFAGWESIPDSIDDPLPEEMQRALGMLD
jgi:prevent-host-death family protein